MTAERSLSSFCENPCVDTLHDGVFGIGHAGEHAVEAFARAHQQNSKLAQVPAAGRQVMGDMEQGSPVTSTRASRSQWFGS